MWTPAPKRFGFLRDAGWLDIDPPRDELDEDDYADAGMVRRENPYAQ
jgi:hypothetical protein